MMRECRIAVSMTFSQPLSAETLSPSTFTKFFPVLVRLRLFVNFIVIFF